MSKQSDLNAFAAAVRFFTNLEIPNVGAWNALPNSIQDAVEYIGAAFTDTDDAHTTLLGRFNAQHGAGGEHTPPNEWIRDGASPIFVNAIQFQLVGDRRADFFVGNRIRAEHAPGVFVIRAIKTVAFDSGPNRTTVTLDPPNAVGLTGALTGIDRALIRQSAPKVSELDLMPMLGSVVSGVTAQVLASAPTQVVVTYRRAIIQGMPLVAAMSGTYPVTTTGGTGASHLDTGTWQPNAWYAVHLCTNDFGTAAALIASASETAPILPVSYTRFAFTGVYIRTTTGSPMELLPMYQEGERVHALSRNALALNGVSGAAGQGDFRSPGFRTVDLTNFVPPGVRQAELGLYFSMASYTPTGLRQFYTQPMLDALAERVAVLNEADGAVAPRHRQTLDSIRRFQFTMVPPASDNTLYGVAIDVDGWWERRAS